MTPTLSLIVLAYNEEENIGPVLDELRAWLEGAGVNSEIIVIDDGSSDSTAERAAKHLGPRDSLIRHQRNAGMGAGIKTGVAAASGEWVTFLPADGQIAPAGVGTLLEASDDVDLVLSVYDHRDDGAMRTILSWGVRALIRAVHGVSIRSEGPYLFRRTLMDARQLPPDTFFLNFEFPIRAMAAQLRTREVTIECRPRLAGESKTARPGRVVAVAKDLMDLRRRRVRETLDRMV